MLLGDFGFFDERVQVCHEVVWALVVHEWLEPQLVFQRNGKRDDEVYGGELGQQVLLSQPTFSLVDVHPDQTREALRCEG